MRLYKYFSPTKRTVESLKTFKFYFARFNQLNDPCELSLSECERDQLEIIRFGFHNPRDCNGIFCLSETRNNLHMWAQYADGHRGIVVEFETEEDPHFFKEMGKVNYLACPPVYNDKMKVSNVIYSKSLDSDKELEWRVFGKHGLRDIKSQAIKSIIFGYRFPRGISVSTDIPEEMNEEFPEEKIEAFREIDSFFWEN